MAVGAVVADHLLEMPSGGFTGVDVFFVISGYLITGLLLREFARSGRIDLIDFYRRRIKRTVPIALMVIVTSLFAGTLLFPAYRFQQLTEAARAASTFSINWQLIGLGTDYLHATDAPSPLQHFWSLAVEEQFYLAWPLAMITVLWIAQRARVRGTVVIALFAIAVLGGSLIWSWWQTGSAPNAAYFSTFSRGWELGAGALLAVAAPALKHLPTTLRPPLAWLGLAGIAFALLHISTGSRFPAPWALLPVISTALVIAATAHGDAQVYPLTNAAARALGDMSYSIYLWHFPVLVFIGALLPASRTTHLLEVTLVAALSVLSFHLIETPLRQASWRSAIRRRTMPRLPARRGRLAIAATALVVGLVSVPALTTTPKAFSDDLASSSALRAALAPDATIGAETAVRAGVEDAAQMTSWPQNVSRDIAAGAQELPAIWVSRGCLWTQRDAETPMSKANRCASTNRTARKTAVLFGDSIALSYYPAVRRALGADTWNIQVLTAEQCPAWDLEVVRDDGSSYPECDRYRSWAIHEIGRTHPDLVIAASSYSALWRARPSDGQSPEDAWRQGTRTTLRVLEAATPHVLVLDAPPMGRALRDCLTPISTPAGCSSLVDRSFVKAFDGENQAIAGGTQHTVHVPTTAWYCTSRGVCPPVIGQHQALADGMHPSEPDAVRIAAPLRRAVVDAVG